MNPDEDTSEDTVKIPEKPKSLRHKFIIKPIKSIFWRVRSLLGKFKNLFYKGQNKIKKETAKPAVSESSGEKVDANNKKS